MHKFLFVLSLPFIFKPAWGYTNEVDIGQGEVFKLVVEESEQIADIRPSGPMRQFHYQ